MSIENLVLSQDQRGISALRPYLAPDYCARAASLILDHPGTVLIATGFYIPAGAAPETDGPPGAIALGRVIASLGSRVLYVTDAYSAPVLRGLLRRGEEVLEFPIVDHQTSWTHAADLVDVARAQPDDCGRALRADRRGPAPQHARRRRLELSREDRLPVPAAPLQHRDRRWRERDRDGQRGCRDSAGDADGRPPVRHRARPAW